MFDAYTVKKVLPRLVIAVILIQLSWFIFTGAIFLTNSIAYGIEGLIYAPFGGPEEFTLDVLLSSLDSSATTVFTTAAIGVAAVTFAGGVFAVVGFIVIAILVAFLTLAIRRMLLIMLVLLAPLALVAWILPNTERFWKMWWDNFSKLLLMYPLILAFIAAGRVFAKVAGEIGGSDMINTVIIIGGYFIPLMLIPKTFSMAGSAFATIGGAVAQRGAGAQNWARGMGQNRQKKKWGERGQQTLAGKAFKGGNDGNLRGRANARLQQLGHVNKAGLRPWKMRENIATAVGATNRQLKAKMKEDADYATWMNNDDLNKAAAATDDAASLKAYLQKNGNYTSQRALEEDVARVEKVRRKYGNETFRQNAVTQAIAGGTAYKSAGEAWRAVANASGGDRAAMADMVAEGRNAAMSAGRVDHGGAGFGDTLSAVEKMWNDDTYSDAAATKDIHTGVLKAQGPGVLTHSSMKPAAIQELMPGMQDRVLDAISAVGSATTPEEKQAAIQNVDTELANVGAIYDGLAATSPQLADEFANSLMGLGISTANLDPALQTEYSGLIEERAPDQVQITQVRQPNGDFKEERKVIPGQVTGQKDGFSIRQLLEARRGQAAVLDRRRELTREEAASGTPLPGPGAAPGGGNPGQLNPNP